MLNRIISLFESSLETDDRKGAGEHAGTIEFAAAILMMEISRADSDVDPGERMVMESAMVRHFQLTDEQSAELLALAEEEVDHSVSLYEFTRVLNDRLTREERVKIIESLWHVAFADAVLDKYEEYYIRKIADLLYVSHKDYIRTKHRASNNMDSE